MNIAWFRHGMAGICHDAQFGLRPRLMQIPGAAQWRHDVVAAVNDAAADVGETVRVAQELIVAIEKAAVDEVVALYARKRERISFLPE